MVSIDKANPTQGAEPPAIAAVFLHTATYSLPDVTKILKITKHVLTLLRTIAPTGTQGPPSPNFCTPYPISSQKSFNRVTFFGMIH